MKRISIGGEKPEKGDKKAATGAPNPAAPEKQVKAKKEKPAREKKQPKQKPQNGKSGDGQDAGKKKVVLLVVLLVALVAVVASLYFNSRPTAPPPMPVARAQRPAVGGPQSKQPSRIQQPSEDQLSEGAKIDAEQLSAEPIKTTGPARRGSGGIVVEPPAQAKKITTETSVPVPTDQDRSAVRQPTIPKIEDLPKLPERAADKTATPVQERKPVAATPPSVKTTAQPEKTASASTSQTRQPRISAAQDAKPVPVAATQAKPAQRQPSIATPAKRTAQVATTPAPAPKAEAKPVSSPAPAKTVAKPVSAQVKSSPSKRTTRPATVQIARVPSASSADSGLFDWPGGQSAGSSKSLFDPAPRVAGTEQRKALDDLAASKTFYSVLIRESSDVEELRALGRRINLGTVSPEIKQTVSRGRNVYWLTVGHYTTSGKAHNKAEELKSLGFQATVVSEKSYY